MSIVQTFYDDLASHYDKLFLDWGEDSKEQAALLHRLFRDNGYDAAVHILDCACGIGTQAIGLARLGYHVTASDISTAEIVEATGRAAEANVEIRFEQADFRALEDVFQEQFDIVIAMDNALPHMLSKDDLRKAVKSIADRIKAGGMFVGSIRDYDTLIETKPPYSPPYIHKTAGGQRVSFQTWDWNEDHYKLVQYIVEDDETLGVSRFACEYRAVRREELTEHFLAGGCSKVRWIFPEESGFYQPIVMAEK